MLFQVVLRVSIIRALHVSLVLHDITVPIMIRCINVHDERIRLLLERALVCLVVLVVTLQRGPQAVCLVVLVPTMLPLVPRVVLIVVVVRMRLRDEPLFAYLV